jgi:hypothetical protein
VLLRRAQDELDQANQALAAGRYGDARRLAQDAEVDARLCGDDGAVTQGRARDGRGGDEHSGAPRRSGTASLNDGEIDMKCTRLTLMGAAALLLSACYTAPVRSPALDDARLAVDAARAPMMTRGHRSRM